MLDVLVESNDSSLNIELGVLQKNMNKEIIGVIDSFISFLTKYDGKKTHDM